mgnify:CR=1 FL=1
MSARFEGIPDTERSDTIGGSATEITHSAHEIMATIAPWTEPFLAYLTRQELPKDQNEARCIVWRSKAYRVHEGELYKKSTTGVLQTELTFLGQRCGKLPFLDPWH